MFLLRFLQFYGLLLYNISPVIIFLLAIIILLGMRVAKMEGWSRSQGIYCAFITATTVGYGVVHPTKPKTRTICVIIAFVGLILTGILVAMAFESLQSAADRVGLMDRIVEEFSEKSGLIP